MSKEIAAIARAGGATCPLCPLLQAFLCNSRNITKMFFEPIWAFLMLEVREGGNKGNFFLKELSF